MLKNKFYESVVELYATNPTKEDLIKHLGRARAKRGMFEGDLEEGELEIGQIAGLIHEVKPVSEIVKDIISEFETRSEEHTSELQSRPHLVCRLLLEKKKKTAEISNQ